MTRPTRNWRPAAVWLFILALVVLHHDFWQWDRIEPLLWGWAPVALWYHVAYTFLCILAMFLLGRWAWPDPPEIASAGEEVPVRGTVPPVTPAEQTHSEGGQRS